MLTFNALFAQPDNAAVLRWMAHHLTAVGRSLNPRAPEIDWSKEIPYFKANYDGHPMDEGGWIFFHRYGARIPAAARCNLEIYNLLAHPRTARIFAIHWGRFSIAIHRDLSRSELTVADLRRFGETLDGGVDVRGLGPGWGLFDDDDEADPEDVFEWACGLAGRDG